VVSQSCKVDSVLLPKPMPPASASKETQFPLNPHLKDYASIGSSSHSPPLCQGSQRSQRPAGSSKSRPRLQNQDGTGRSLNGCVFI